MTQEKVQWCASLRVGDTVTVVEESGFRAGISQTKTIAEILITTWTAEEAANQGVPRQEPLFKFTDGTLAGCFDRNNQGLAMSEPMTDERLAEIEAKMAECEGWEEFPPSMTQELLAEVKRLREVNKELQEAYDGYY